MLNKTSLQLAATRAPKRKMSVARGGRTTPEPAANKRGGGREDSPRTTSGQQISNPRAPIFRSYSNPEKASSFGGSKKSDRKIDLTHLTNFTLAPREREEAPKKHYRPQQQRFNRERFLQAK